MTTSAYNQRRRKRRRDDKKNAKRRMRHTGGDWKFPDYGAQWQHPNWQYNREDQGKDKR